MKTSAVITASVLAFAAMNPAVHSSAAEHDHSGMAGMQKSGCPDATAMKDQTSCGKATPTSASAAHQATGVVKKTDAATSTATIAHGAVKDLNWPPMTMKFKVKDKAVLDQLKVDKKVDFTFVQEGNNYVITAAR